MSDDQPGNLLLSRWPGGLSDDLTVIDLKARETVHAPGEPIENVLFPLDAVVSIVADMDNGAVVEIATVGREGMVGIEVLLRADQTTHRAFVQVAGRAVTAPAALLLELTRAHDDLDRLLHRYIQALVAQVARSTACNQAHSIDERTARWLLMTHDRVGREDFDLTQEFLGQMLGVTRPRVSTAAATMQRAGFIRYSRGHMTVTDRAGLEQASCECYRVITDEYTRLVG